MVSVFTHSHSLTHNPHWSPGQTPGALEQDNDRLEALSLTPAMAPFLIRSFGSLP